MGGGGALADDGVNGELLTKTENPMAPSQPRGVLIIPDEQSQPVSLCQPTSVYPITGTWTIEFAMPTRHIVSCDPSPKRKHPFIDCKPTRLLSGNRRNEPCDCGCGKKRKRCGKNKP